MAWFCVAVLDSVAAMRFAVASTGAVGVCGVVLALSVLLGRGGDGGSGLRTLAVGLCTALPGSVPLLGSGAGGESILRNSVLLVQF